MFNVCVVVLHEVSLNQQVATKTAPRPQGPCGFSRPKGVEC